MRVVISPGDVALPAGSFGRRTISGGSCVKSAAALNAAFSSRDAGRRQSIGRLLVAFLCALPRKGTRTSRE